MRLLAVVISALLLAHCAKAPDQPEPSPAPGAVSRLFAEASQRLTAGYLEDGWVVSRLEDGTPEHRGDSLIWTGMAVGVLSCEDGAPVRDALLKALNDDAGKLKRHPLLPDSVSMDGALGLYWGVAKRVKRCPSELPSWQDAFKKHRAYLADHGGLLNAASSARLEGDFDAALDGLLNLLGLAHPPSSERRHRLGTQAAAWAFATLAKRAACFRAHLGLLALQTLETVDLPTSDAGRDAFCQATAGGGLVTTDHYCGREGLPAWVDAFSFNAREFAHQRCSWESPDGRAGLTTPGLDLLVAIRQAHAI